MDPMMEDTQLPPEATPPQQTMAPPAGPAAAAPAAPAAPMASEATPDELSAFEEFVLTALTKLVTPEVMGPLSQSTQAAEEPEMAIASAASMAARKTFDTAAGDFTEEMIVPAGIEIAVYLHQLLAEAGAIAPDERSQLLTVQATVAAILQDYEIDPSEIDVDALAAEALPADQRDQLLTQIAMMNGG